jgi:hypothetical protein
MNGAGDIREELLNRDRPDVGLVLKQAAISENFRTDHRIYPSGCGSIRQFSFGIGFPGGSAIQCIGRQELAFYAMPWR